MRFTLGSRLSGVSISWNLRSLTKKLLIIFYQVKKVMSIPLPRINPKEKEQENPAPDWNDYYEEDEE